MSEQDKPTTNYGITISGNGKLEADQVAVGQGAQAIKTIYGTADGMGNTTLATALKDLTAAIQEQIKDEKEQAEVLDTLKTLAEELKKERPNKVIGGSLLQGLEQAVGSITNIAAKLAPFIIAAKATLGIP
jgi:hypothetical protein